jgi:hypothetical protein
LNRTNVEGIRRAEEVEVEVVVVEVVEVVEVVVEGGHIRWTMTMTGWVMGRKEAEEEEEEGV